LFPLERCSQILSPAVREDEEVPKSSSHKPRDVPCGGRRMRGENAPPALCVTDACAAPLAPLLRRPALRCR
jgi:hypothetical protein